MDGVTATFVGINITTTVTLGYIILSKLSKLEASHKYTHLRVKTLENKIDKIKELEVEMKHMNKKLDSLTQAIKS
jgi:hypothetical protein